MLDDRASSTWENIMANEQDDWREAIDVAGLFACLLKPAMISFLDTMVDAAQDDAAALTHAQRQQREAEAQADLLDSERQEAALTWSAIEQNLPVEFRPDINPIALLGLRLITTARTTEMPETSQGHSWLRR
jgi:hypothetical protein